MAHARPFNIYAESHFRRDFAPLRNRKKSYRLLWTLCAVTALAFVSLWPRSESSRLKHDQQGGAYRQPYDTVIPSDGNPSNTVKSKPELAKPEPAKPESAKSESAKPKLPR